ncbi:MAG: riboflavin synthase [Planctomycetes bacterium]|nr:riboflavin synthase [Planctomycetota bacterium]
MFTGIIEHLGEVVHIEKSDEKAQIQIDLGPCAAGIEVGDSASINGVCLTVVEIQDKIARFDVITETLARSNLGKLAARSKVNCERAMQAGARFDGHFVQGHVDSVAQILSRAEGKGQTLITIEIPGEFAHYVVQKGSVTIDGISLTVAGIDSGTFSVALIPLTLEKTTLGFKVPGDSVNIEFDLIGKYVLRYFAVREEFALEEDNLRDWGYDW